MRKRSLAGFLAIVCAAWLSAARADVPQLIGFQGYLTSSAGTPINASVQVVFRLYTAPTGGTPIWTETQTVAVANGVYDAVLGSVTPLAIAFDTPYYLGIAVGTDAEMTPRRTLLSAPYSLRSGCNPGDRVTCYTGTGTPGVGLCQTGTRICNAAGTGWSACNGEVTPNCGTSCVDLQSDTGNCGTCGHACTAGQVCTAGACVGGCANPSGAQVVSASIYGCPGTSAFANRASLCAPTWHVCSAAEWVARHGTTAPTHDYWTNDTLGYSNGASTNNCAVGTAQPNSCSAGTSMLVCTAAGTDTEGNHCNITNCGLNSTTPQYFGGCPASNNAGALCCS